MTLTVKNDRSELLELLWVREAWGLQPKGDVPPPLIRTPIQIATAAPEKNWEETWTGLWEACAEHAGRSTSGLIEQLQNTPPESQERARLLRSLVGPSWRERFGDRAFDQSFTAWQQESLEDIGRANAVPLDESPERRSVEALAAAWEAGLTTVVTIPCTGEHTRVLSETALLVTESTRQDPHRYATALTTFSNHTAK